MDQTQDDQRKRTIVGGRPRGRALGRAGVPRGIEVLLKKASLDPAFCTLLLEQRAAAAREIALELTPAERTILNSVPEPQLRAMIDHTTVPDAQRRAFLGTLGAAMLAAVVAGCTPPTYTVGGIRPEDMDTSTPVVATHTPVEMEKGIRPGEATPPPRTPSPTVRTPTPEAGATVPPIEADSDDKPTSPVVRGIRPDRP